MTLNLEKKSLISYFFTITNKARETRIPEYLRDIEGHQFHTLPGNNSVISFVAIQSYLLLCSANRWCDKI